MVLGYLGIAMITAFAAALGVGWATGSWLMAFAAYSASGCLTVLLILAGTAIVPAPARQDAPRDEASPRRPLAA